VIDRTGDASVVKGVARRVLAAMAGLALAGCAATDFFHNVPDEKTPQPEYPNVGEVPPNRPTPPLTAEEQARAQAELKALAATRQKTMERKLETEQ
jgi:type IV pilus biogenesis protein CpaD/CtpE